MEYMHSILLEYASIPWNTIQKYSTYSSRILGRDRVRSIIWSIPGIREVFAN